MKEQNKIENWKTFREWKQHKEFFEKNPEFTHL